VEVMDDSCCVTARVPGADWWPGMLAGEVGADMLSDVCVAVVGADIVFR
jgi:hypothetical protein